MIMFLRYLFINLKKVINSIYNDFYCRPMPLKLTPAEQISFDKAKTCHICKKELLTDKVRDHCHFTGKYRGAAHNSCNLQCRKPMILPVIAGLPRARSARGTEPHTHRLWSTSFPLVVT